MINIYLIASNDERNSCTRANAGEYYHIASVTKIDETVQALIEKYHQKGGIEVYTTPAREEMVYGELVATFLAKVKL